MNRDFIHHSATISHNSSSLKKELSVAKEESYKISMLGADSEVFCVELASFGNRVSCYVRTAVMMAWHNKSSGANE